jgi:hypothetical protein
MRFGLTLVLLAWWAVAGAGCSVSDSRNPAPVGEAWASIRVTEGAFTGPTKGATGYFFHVREAANGGDPRLTGSRYENGVRREVFGGASGSAGVVLAIRAVGLEPFDFAAEVADTVARHDLMLPFVMDGAQYEITLPTSTWVLVLRAWNPGPTINALAPHSENIAKLKAVLDLLAQSYGRSQFGV